MTDSPHLLTRIKKNRATFEQNVEWEIVFENSKGITILTSN